MRLIRARVAEASTDASRTLYARARADQLLNIWALVPLLCILNVASTVVLRTWPDLFIAHAGHVWLISAQLITFMGYLFYTGRYFSSIAPLVLRSRSTA
jgi:thiosulfate reductase cytochrome b subunit